MHINIEHAAIAPTRRALARPACGRPSSIERSGRARKLNRTPAHGRETTRPPHSCSFGNCCGRLRFVGVAFGRRRHRPHRRRGAFAPGAFAPHAALGAALGAAAALGVAKLLSKAAARRAALGGRVACERERGRSRGRRRRVLERSSRLVQVRQGHARASLGRLPTEAASPSAVAHLLGGLASLLPPRAEVVRCAAGRRRASCGAAAAQRVAARCWAVPTAALPVP